ncbi:class I SAM-dependent methyltransferase [Pseudooceanicola sp. MF1-13]|uniref:class I SAM-dependent methyltransferase n=1 Tax=Pseudooceanicola sp. MF1-13 TaxID=3379095 RepID=UPI00389121E2
MNGTNFQKIEDVQISDVAKIWDDLAPVRYQDIDSGKDRSYTEVLLPLLEEFSAKTSGSKLVDAGCGVGFGSKVAARHFKSVDAVDPSKASIALGESKNFAPNIRYFHSSAEDFSKGHNDYDALISSMVLMDCPNSKEFLKACHLMVRPGGKMIFTLCHPFFWPRYWGFEKYGWFNYGSEFAIQSNFRTSSTGLSKSKTIYFHRPLSNYLSDLTSLGVESLNIREISGVAVKSQVLNRYPRYLSIEVVK